MSIITDYTDVVGEVVREWIDSIDKIEDLLNPEIAPAEYLVYLGKLIGVTPPASFDSADADSVSQFRSTLNQAIDWYKMKGTYHSIQIIALILGLDITIFDMYTNDYSTFVYEEWFVGKEVDENPDGLDDTYYKSPHFGVWENLKYVYPVTAAQPYGHLWASSYLPDLLDYIEVTRPVHTVPHFVLYLNPVTDKYETAWTVDGNIETQLKNIWSDQGVFFDRDSIGSGEGFDFDDGTLFDTSSVTSVQDITKWVLGTGWDGSAVDDSGYTDVKTPALEGTIDANDITDEGDYYKLRFTVPKASVQAGINELGLYIPGTPDLLITLSVFPDIEKNSLVELIIDVYIYKEELSA